MKLNIKAKTVLLLLTLCFFSALISSCGLATLTTTEHVFVMHTATDPTCTEYGSVWC